MTPHPITHINAQHVENVLSINGLKKRYGGITAVDSLNLEIPRGAIYGILGPNGSGKTTTLGMVLDVIRPTEGAFLWFGQEPTTEVRKRIGAILEAPLFYPYLTGANNLKVVAKIKGVPYSAIDEWLERVGLLERRDSPFSTYSLGMKQRLAIAAAMLSNPEVLILDEPTNGLDPQGIAEIRSLVREIGNSGVTVMLASHLLDEVEKVCTHVSVLQRGKLLYSGPVAGMSGQTPKVELAAADLAALQAAMQRFPGVDGMDKIDGRLLVRFFETPDTAMINRYLFDQGVVASRLVLRSSSLEEQFLEITSTPRK
jgi:ABC-2 type transport system ATP-binding protein